jgi:hypothetical protein
MEITSREEKAAVGNKAMETAVVREDLQGINK